MAAGEKKTDRLSIPSSGAPYKGSQLAGSEIHVSHQPDFVTPRCDSCLNPDCCTKKPFPVIEHSYRFFIPWKAVFLLLSKAVGKYPFRSFKKQGPVPIG